MAKKRKKVARKVKEASEQDNQSVAVTKMESEHPIVGLRQQMEDMFEHYFKQWPDLLSRPGLGWDFGQTIGPKMFDRPLTMDMSESDNGYEISAELPGLDEGDIDISVTGDLLTIKGEKQEEREEEKKEYHLKERRYGRFHRSLKLPQDVNASKIQASFNKGVLNLELPKLGSAKKKSRKIDIKSS